MRPTTDYMEISPSNSLFEQHQALSPHDDADQLPARHDEIDDLLPLGVALDVGFRQRSGFECCSVLAGSRHKTLIAPVPGGGPWASSSLTRPRGARGLPIRVRRAFRAFGSGRVTFATVRYFKVPADLLPRWCGRHLVFLSYLTLQLIGGRVGDNEAALLCN